MSVDFTNPATHVREGEEIDAARVATFLKEKITGLEGDEDPDDDGRRRYYELSSLGREVLGAEAERLQVLVDAARAGGALSRA